MSVSKEQVYEAVSDLYCSAKETTQKDIYQHLMMTLDEEPKQSTVYSRLRILVQEGRLSKGRGSRQGQNGRPPIAYFPVQDGVDPTETFLGL